MGQPLTVTSQPPTDKLAYGTRKAHQQPGLDPVRALMCERPYRVTKLDTIENVHSTDTIDTQT